MGDLEDLTGGGSGLAAREEVITFGDNYDDDPYGCKNAI